MSQSTNSTTNHWYVYVLVSTTANRTYVGISKNPDQRLLEHNGERPGGAKATRGHRPWRLGRIYGPIETKSEALKLEHQIKQEVGADRLLVEWEPALDAGG